MDEFADVVNELLNVDQSLAACLVNLDRLGAKDSHERRAIYFDETLTSERYAELLREGPLERAWFAAFDRYVCCSGNNRWCIYCERKLDVAAIALRANELASFSKPLELLRAQDFIAAYDDYYALFPWNPAANNFRKAMAESYSEIGDKT